MGDTINDINATLANAHGKMPKVRDQEEAARKEAARKEAAREEAAREEAAREAIRAKSESTKTPVAQSSKTTDSNKGPKEKSAKILETELKALKKELTTVEKNPKSNPIEIKLLNRQIVQKEVDVELQKAIENPNDQKQFSIFAKKFYETIEKAGKDNDTEMIYNLVATRNRRGLKEILDKLEPRSPAELEEEYQKSSSNQFELIAIKDGLRPDYAAKHLKRLLYYSWDKELKKHPK